VKCAAVAEEPNDQYGWQPRLCLLLCWARCLGQLLDQS
jgi:hypothetical protein